MAGPFGDLGGIDAAVESSGQAGVPEIIRPPGQGRGLLCCGERRLARFDPRTLVGDRAQLAAPDAAEHAAVRCGAELLKVIAQQPRKLGMGGHDPAVAFRPVLELPAFPRASVIGRVATGVGRGTPKVQLTPPVIVLCVLR